MRFGKLVEAHFIRRPNRFGAFVSIDGVETYIHVANSGRMRELLVEGRRMYLKPAPGNNRKTAFDLALVDLGHTMASADARLPNLLVYEAIKDGRLPDFGGYDTHVREVTYGESRLDIVLYGTPGTCYIETKSVTLVVDDNGLFPDAPTTRGRKHMESLSKAAREGHRAAVIFVVQRDDVRRFAPNDAADPEFGVALRQAIDDGVEAYAYKCNVTTREISLADRLPVGL